MSGFNADLGITVAHADSWAGIGTTDIADRATRENALSSTLAPLATHAVGPGHRAVPEEADPYRTVSNVTVTASCTHLHSADLPEKLKCLYSPMIINALD